MSRIAGLLNKRNDHNPSMIEAMLESQRTCKEWSKTTEKSHLFYGGWLGEDNAKILKKDVVVILDGHIFNLPELCDEKTKETYLILSMYRQFGFEKMLARINGDFALAVFDSAQDTLWLGRDRIGLKPLFYIKTAEYFAFSSRIKALLQIPGVTKTTRTDFVGRFAGSHYRTFDNDIERSPFEDVFQVPAAHYLCLKQNTMKIGRYWNLEDKTNWESSPHDLADQYRDLLIDSVKLRMQMAKKPAFTLSGGMDSSSIMASAVKTTNQKQHAFSTVYTDKTYDESDEIVTMLELCVEEWHRVQIGDNIDIINLVENMISLHDEPVATATWLSHYILCEQVKKKGFGSLFGGLGGDELNAGEYEHFFYFFSDLKSGGHEDRLKREIVYWCKYHDHPIYKKSFKLVESYFKSVVNLNIPGLCLPDIKRINCYKDVLNPEYFDLSAYMPVMDHPFKSYIKNRTYQDMMRETVPCCLRAEDRQTMAFDLGNFLPFFDHRLIEFMFRVPEQLKYNDGVTKYLLRQAMKGVLPEKTRTRIQKTGWNAPAHIWFSGKGQSVLEDLIRSKKFQERGIYNIQKVKHLLKEHNRIILSNANQDNHMMFFWQLVNLELWFQWIETL